MSDAPAGPGDGRALRRDTTGGVCGPRRGASWPPATTSSHRRPVAGPTRPPASVRPVRPDGPDAGGPRPDEPTGTGGDVFASWWARRRPPRGGEVTPPGPHRLARTLEGRKWVIRLLPPRRLPRS